LDGFGDIGMEWQILAGIFILIGVLLIFLLLDHRLDQENRDAIREALVEIFARNIEVRRRYSSGARAIYSYFVTYQDEAGEEHITGCAIRRSMISGNSIVWDELPGREFSRTSLPANDDPAPEADSDEANAIDETAEESRDDLSESHIEDIPIFSSRGENEMFVKYQKLILADEQRREQFLEPGDEEMQDNKEIRRRVSGVFAIILGVSFLVAAIVAADWPVSYSGQVKAVFFIGLLVSFLIFAGVRELRNTNKPKDDQ
jgi:hypothetical protein